MNTETISITPELKERLKQTCCDVIDTLIAARVTPIEAAATLELCRASLAEQYGWSEVFVKYQGEAGTR